MNEHPKTALLLKNRHNTMTDYNASPVILQKKKKKILESSIIKIAVLNKNCSIKNHSTENDTYKVLITNNLLYRLCIYAERLPEKYVSNI